jgi:hypothetical protein
LHSARERAQLLACDASWSRIGTHFRATLTGRDLYQFPADLTGGFWSLNFEQQAVVLENYARLSLGQSVLRLTAGKTLDPETVRRLYGGFLGGP